MPSQTHFLPSYRGCHDDINIRCFRILTDFALGQTYPILLLIHVPIARLMSQCKQIFGDIILLLARSSSNSPQSLEGFSQVWDEISFKSDNGLRISPQTPIVKIARFRKHYNVAGSGQILQWGSMGKFFICCGIQLKFGLRVRLTKDNLCLIGQKVKIISPKICLHQDMKRTIERMVCCMK